MERYISKALKPYIEMDIESWSSNLIKVSTMFISLGFDLSQLRDNEGLLMFHRIIEIVQRILYQNQGTLNKLLMDDKGTTLIAIFGSVPTTHSNDSSRAVSASLDLAFHLKRVNINVNVGITTSRVFAGVVGSSGGRREYSLLGDGVNLAARLMQLACSTTEHNIFLDENTFTESSNEMKCCFHSKVKVKGKDNMIKVYYPKDKYRICFSGSYRQRNPDKMKNFMKKYLNSLMEFLIFEVIPVEDNNMEVFQLYMIEKDENFNKLSHEIIGREEELESLINHLEKFNEKNKKDSRCLIIHGETGSGKNFFLNKGLFKYKGLSTFQKYLLFFTSFTPSEYKYPYNAIRYLYARIISFSREILKPEHFGSETKFIRNLCLKCYEKNEYALKVLSKELDNFLNLVSIYKQTEIYINKVFDSVSHSTRECGKFVLRALVIFFQHEFLKVGPEKMIFVFDQSALIDKESMEILKFLLVSLNDIFFIFLLNTPLRKKNSTFETVEQFGDYFFEEGVKGGEIFLNKLNKEESNKLVDTFFKIKYSGYQINMSQKIKDYIYERCKGNCKDTFCLIDSLIQNNHIFFEKQDVLCSIDKVITQPISEVFNFCLSEELEVSLKIETFNKFIVSPTSLENKYRSMLNKITPELALTINMAAVLGDIFDDITLKQINIFSQFSNTALNRHLHKLISLEFIEVIGITQEKKIYRFTHPFLRRLMYQRMLFEHRRSLHKVYLEFLRVNPMPSYLWGSKTHLKDNIIEEHLEYHFINSKGNISEDELEVSHFKI